MMICFLYFRRRKKKTKAKGRKSADLENQDPDVGGTQSLQFSKSRKLATHHVAMGNKTFSPLDFEKSQEAPHNNRTPETRRQEDRRRKTPGLVNGSPNNHLHTTTVWRNNALWQQLSTSSLLFSFHRHLLSWCLLGTNSLSWHWRHPHHHFSQDKTLFISTIVVVRFLDCAQWCGEVHKLWGGGWGLLAVTFVKWVSECTLHWLLFTCWL